MMDHQGDTAAQQHANRISARLGALIVDENSRREEKGEPALRYADIAERINRRAGKKVISMDTIRNLHLGRAAGGGLPNPTIATLDAVGVAFGIREGARYFLSEDTSEIDRQLRNMRALADLRSGGSELMGLMNRAAGLSEESVKLVAGLAERLQEIERAHGGTERQND
ncbi:hypothetical protein [Kitasatospora sp. NPDC127060]|uniref:hypothetical protein n=1 Tax=Kitasatospora sp. NPDC127060 TaxID=3347121 RepID=UPI00364E34E2